MNTQEWEVPKTLVKKLNTVSKSVKFVKRYVTDIELNMIQEMSHSKLGHVSIIQDGNGWLTWGGVQVFINTNEKGRVAVYS